MTRQQPSIPCSSSFIPPIASLNTPPPSQCTKRCCQRPQVTRRAALRHVAGAAGALFAALLGEAAHAEDPKNKPTESFCKNCSGSGKISCELCSGTGFWRALGKSDARQLYKGVVCPECEGLGQLTCPVCLGTGEGEVRGLLRRRTIEPGAGRVLQSNG